MPLDETGPNYADATQAQQFQLFGSVRLAVPADEFDAWLEQNRKTQADLAALKLADL